MRSLGAIDLQSLGLLTAEHTSPLKSPSGRYQSVTERRSPGGLSTNKADWRPPSAAVIDAEVMEQSPATEIARHLQSLARTKSRLAVIQLGF